MCHYSPRLLVTCFAALVLLVLGNPRLARAVDVAVARSNPCREPIIQGYEPTTLGYAWQANDEPFVDFTLSFKAPLFRDLLCEHFAGKGHLYLTFTGKFAFYVRKRDSDPVIAREYNPKLLWRFLNTGKKTQSAGYDDAPIEEYAQYIDFAYAHSSDGQSINSLQGYEIQSYQSGSARDALDYISRGWDYVQITGKQTLQGAWLREGDFRIYPDFKLFLRHGFLQQVPEEYHSWEQSSTLLPRHAFDGLGITLEYLPFAQRIAAGPNPGPRNRFELLKRSLRFDLKFLTGYDPIAQYDTIRGEVGFSPFGLPLTVWAQDGYMSSLARYFTKTKSAGVELRFAQF